MQNVYRRIGKTKFKWLVIAVILVTDFRWVGVLHNLLDSNPSILGNIAPADQFQLGILVDRSINLGAKLIIGFQICTCALFLADKWHSRKYLSTYSAITIFFLIWNSSNDPTAIFFLIAQNAIFFGLYNWKIIFENLEQENWSAKAKSNLEAEHSRL
jgi:hypothetical protein